MDPTANSKQFLLDFEQLKAECQSYRTTIGGAPLGAASIRTQILRAQLAALQTTDGITFDHIGAAIKRIDDNQEMTLLLPEFREDIAAIRTLWSDLNDSSITSRASRCIANANVVDEMASGLSGRSAMQLRALNPRAMYVHRPVVARNPVRRFLARLVNAFFPSCFRGYLEKECQRDIRQHVANLIGVARDCGRIASNRAHRFDSQTAMEDL